MIYTVFMQRLDPYSHNLLFEIFDAGNNLVAEVKKDKKNTTRLYYNNAVYDFPFSLRSISKPAYSFAYAVSQKKSKKIGYHIKKNDVVIAEYYGESAVVEKKILFSKKIGFEVFKYDGNVYIVVKVGLPKEFSHYYCLKDSKTNRTVGIIERLQSNNEDARAKIYFVERCDAELMLMLLATETVMNVTSNAEGQIIDPSAGKYISVRNEERNFLDKGFLELAKQK